MMCLLDLALGSLYSLGPVGKKDSVRSRKKRDIALLTAAAEMCKHHWHVSYLCTQRWREWTRWWIRSPSPSLRSGSQWRDRRRNLPRSPAWRRSHANRQMTQTDKTPTPTTNTRRHVRGTTVNTDFTDKTCTHTHTDVVERGQTL